MPATSANVPVSTPALDRFLACSNILATHRISAFTPDPNPEARAYSGCSYVLTGPDGLSTRTVFRAAKVTPTKAGLFVTLWQRGADGETRPYALTDDVETFIVWAATAAGCGYFHFPAGALAEHGILSGGTRPGKRGFRLYTPWDKNLNANASRTWDWQRNYFTIATG